MFLTLELFCNLVTFKVLLHDAIFLATCNKSLNVASCKEKSHRVTPRGNLRFCYFCRVAKLQEKLDVFYFLPQLSTKFASC